MTRRPQHPYPLTDKQDFAAWRVQHRRAYQLLDTVIFEWRGRNATLRGHAGKWAAYSQAEWMEKSGLSVNAMKLEFFRLELDGLIERQPGSWDGFKPRTFIRPTPLAISFMNPRPTDYAKLGQSRQSKSSPTGHPKASPEKPPKGQPNGEPHITSFPSNPPNPTDLFAHAHAHTGGKGKAGADEKIKKKKLILKKPIPKTPIPPPTDDEEAAFKAMKVKSLEKWLAVFPRIEGDHGVWHPADQHDAWTGWSFELKKERYAVYVAYVTKALKSKSAKKAKGKSGDGDSGFYTGKKPGGLFGLLKKT